MTTEPQPSTFVSQLSELHTAASQPHIHGGSKYLTCKACKALHELEDFLPPRAEAILALIEAASGFAARRLDGSPAHVARWHRDLSPPHERCRCPEGEIAAALEALNGRS